MGIYNDVKCEDKFITSIFENYLTFSCVISAECGEGKIRLVGAVKNLKNCTKIDEICPINSQFFRAREKGVGSAAPLPSSNNAIAYT